MKNLMIVSAALLATVSVAMAEPALSNSAKDIQLSQKNCLKAAMKVLEENGFTDNHVAGQSAFGRYEEDYIGSLRCIAERKIVFSAVAGPDGEVASKLATDIIENFPD